MTTYDLGTQLFTEGWGYKASEAGGVINGGFFQRPLADWDPELTPWSEWHRVNIAMTIVAPRVSVCGTRFDNVGDAVCVAAVNQYKAGDNFALGSLKATRVHDDFIENDGMRSGIVFNCLADGVMTGFSCRYGGYSETPRTGINDVMHIEKCLIRLQGYYNSYNTAKYGFNRHASFFKWSSIAPRVDLKDNTFAAASKGIDVTSLDPPSTLRTCTGTRLLWLGAGQWPTESANKWRAVDPGVEILSGVAAQQAWNSAVANWKR